MQPRFKLIGSGDKLNSHRDYLDDETQEGLNPKCETNEPTYANLTQKRQVYHVTMTTQQRHHNLQVVGSYRICAFVLISDSHGKVMLYTGCH